MERLVADHDLAEAILKKKDAIIRWSRLYEEHGDVYRELAAANAKIARVKEVADKNGRMTADLFSDDKPAYALYGYFEASLRTALADPAPGEPK